MELYTFSIPTFRKIDIEKRLEKLAKKAAKYGNNDISFSFGETHIVNIDTKYGKREVEFIDITVCGDAPKIGGWDFFARVELLSGDENLVHLVPGTNTILETKFRTHDGHCDHCNTQRPRNDVYVLSNDDKQMAVGRSCLHDFLGIDDPKNIVNRAQFFEELSDIKDEDFSSFANYGYYDLKTVLLTAAAFIRTKGYVSKAKQSETGYFTTGEEVQYCIGDVPGYSIEINDDDRKWMNNTLQFFKVETSFNNDYMDNIRVLMKQDIIKKEHIALISSAVITTQRKLAEANKSTVGRDSSFIGEVKQRLRDLNLNVEKIIFLGSGDWGPSYLHLMKDETGNVFSLISSNKMSVAEGSFVKIDATVKLHKLYNGIKQTVLTRAKQKT